LKHSRGSISGGKRCKSSVQDLELAHMIRLTLFLIGPLRLRRRKWRPMPRKLRNRTIRPLDSMETKRPLKEPFLRNSLKESTNSSRTSLSISLFL